MATIKSQLSLNDAMSVVLQRITKNMQTLNGSFVAMQESCDNAVHIKNFESAANALGAQLSMAEQLTSEYGDMAFQTENVALNLQDSTEALQKGTGAADGLMGKVKGIVSTATALLRRSLFSTGAPSADAASLPLRCR